MRRQRGSRRPPGALATLVALAICLGLGPAAPTTARRGRLPHVLVVVVDTLRADRVQALHAAGRLPHIGRWLDAGARFVQTHSSSSWTPTATASLFTSLHPLQHGVMRGRLAVRGARGHARSSPFHALPDTTTTLPEVLSEAGYVTLGVADNPHIDRSAGFARGFDAFVTHADRGAPRVVASAIGLLRQLREASAQRPRLLYLHFMDPHAPYRRHGDGPRVAVQRSGGEAHHQRPERPGGWPGRGVLARERAAYDAEIVHVDAAIGRLLREPQLRDWLRDALVVFTADHGEAFGEHGQVGHVNHLYEELLRVPLAFHWPGHIPSGTHAARASVLDVLPTLRGLLGLRPAVHERGRDHSQRLQLGPGAVAPGATMPPRIDYAARDGQLALSIEPEAMSEGVESRPGGPLRRRSVSDGRYKLIWVEGTDREEAYDLNSDPGERRELLRVGRLPVAARRRLARARRRITALPRHAARLVHPESVDADLMRRLSALGYAAP